MHKNYSYHKIALSLFIKHNSISLDKQIKKRGALPQYSWMDDINTMDAIILQKEAILKPHRIMRNIILKQFKKKKEIDKRDYSPS